MAPTTLNSNEKVVHGKKRAQTWMVYEVGGVILADGVSRLALKPKSKKTERYRDSRLKGATANLSGK